MEIGPHFRTLRIVKAVIVVDGVETEIQIQLGDGKYLAGVAGLDTLLEWAKTQKNAEPIGAQQISRPPEGGTLFVPSEEDKRNIRLFGNDPCWFPGCQELRDQYQQELEAREKEGECKKCEKGTLMRKYLRLAAELQALQSPPP